YNPLLRWYDCYSMTVRWPLSSSDHQVRSIAEETEAIAYMDDHAEKET
ncbi:hypothetical protein A2U01_0067186, partial [Trifolium medium]|nr:hypothetical protein [Trifolium medium]